MKEMTIEEKAKAYDEAINVARSKIKNDKNHILYEEDITDIFHELKEKESEDERIRKALIQNLKERFGTKGTMGGILDMPRVLAWLEKQDKEEYALKSCKDEDVRKFAQYIEKQAKAYEFNLPNRGYDIYAFAKDILVWLERQDEQKPEIEEINGEDYGIDGLWHAQRILERTLGSVEGYQSDDGILDHKAAITAVKKLYEQKPAEWSKKDEKIWKELIEEVKDQFDSIPAPDCRDKEDEKVLKQLNKWLTWLKSLRHQKQWKPSEKQKKALKWVLTVPYCRYEKEINELLEQLEQL